MLSVPKYSPPAPPSSDNVAPIFLQQLCGFMLNASNRTTQIKAAQAMCNAVGSISSSLLHAECSSCIDFLIPVFSEYPNRSGEFQELFIKLLLLLTEHKGTYLLRAVFSELKLHS